MPVVTLSEKGWIVIPKEIRKRYGLKKGDKISIVDMGRGVYLFPAPKDAIGESFGMFKDGPSLTEALLEERRLEKKREEEKLRRWGVEPVEE
jgi:AbrB family looped-hinge helix DNA binding protein